WSAASFRERAPAPERKRRDVFGTSKGAAPPPSPEEGAGEGPHSRGDRGGEEGQPQEVLIAPSFARWRGDGDGCPPPRRTPQAISWNACRMSRLEGRWYTASPNSGTIARM